MFWNIINIMPTVLDSGKNYALDGLKPKFNPPALDLSYVQGFYHPKVRQFYSIYEPK